MRRLGRGLSGHIGADILHPIPLLQLVDGVQPQRGGHIPPRAVAFRVDLAVIHQLLISRAHLLINKPNRAAANHHLVAQLVHRPGVCQVAVVHSRQIRQVAGVAADVLLRLDAVHKHQVGPGRDVGPAARHRILPPVDGIGVAAGDDDKIGVAAGVQGGADFLHVFRDGNHLLAGKKAALLGKQLVLQMDGRHAGRLVFPHRALHIQRVAVARVGIADDGNVHRIGDIFGVGNHLGHREQPHIGEAPLGRSAGAGHINRPMPHILGNAGVQGIQHKGGNRHPV